MNISDLKSMLCVGGPRDGQRMDSQVGSGFVVPTSKPLPPTLGNLYPTKVEVEFTKYKAEFFNTPQGELSFWVPENQTPLETMTRLLESYEQQRAANR